MPELPKIPPIPPPPPPQTRVVDASGAMTKEFYDYLLRLNTALAAIRAAVQNAAG